MTTPPTSPPTVLLVDDDPSVLDTLAILLRTRGHCRVVTAASIGEARERLAQALPTVVVTDIAMDGREAGIELLEEVRRLSPDLPVLLMSAVGTREAAIRAINARAFAFLQKPFRNEELERLVRDAIAQAAWRHDARTTAQARSRQANSRRHNQPGRVVSAPVIGEPLGESPLFLETLTMVELAAPRDIAILLEGESGVGKGVLAAYCHAQSARAAAPFLAINCGALPESLLESQLFGHVRGAFTGADRDAIGLLRAADGGTLFLDEVGDLSPATQVKLLRVLQEREVLPVGGTAPTRVDVRVIAATNRDLRQMVHAGRFRADLFWRLHVLAVRIPPLRERPEDIGLLARAILERLRQHDPQVVATGIAEDALARLLAYPWPGNIRELENVLARSALLAPGPLLRLEDLPAEFQADRPGSLPVVGTSAPGPGLLPPGAWPTLALMEQAYALWMLHHCQGDVVRAAERLGVPVEVVRQLTREMVSGDRPSGGGDLDGGLRFPTG